MKDTLFKTLLIKRNSEVNILFKIMLQFKKIKFNKFLQIIETNSREKKTIFLLENIGEYFLKIRYITLKNLRNFYNYTFQNILVQNFIERYVIN